MPMRLPFEVRLYASAMLRTLRSWRPTIGRIPTAAAVSIILLAGETEDRVYAFAAQHLGDCLASLHTSIPSPCRTAGKWRSATGRTRPDQVLLWTINFVLIIACNLCVRQTAEQIVRLSGAPNR